MRIENKLDDMCTACPAFELDASSTTMYGGNEIVERSIVIDCENRETCNKIRNNFMKFDPLTGRRIQNVAFYF